MPLKSGDTPKSIQYNIQELIRAGYPPTQAKAIAYAEARRTSRSADTRRKLKPKKRTKKHA